MTNPQSPIPNLHFPITAASMRIVALSGGVGGAKLVDGLASILLPENLTAVVNTGDDFDHLGLRICPDLDTVMYTLAGLGDQARGWGLCDESFHALDMLDRYGGETWFRLSDADLGTHLLRTHALGSGQTLTQVTQRLSAALGVRVRIRPATESTPSTRTGITM